MWSRYPISNRHGPLTVFFSPSFLSFFGGENPIESLLTQETVSDRFPPTYAGKPAVSKMSLQFCGLACILGLTSPNNQVSLNTEERSAQS